MQRYLCFQQPVSCQGQQKHIGNNNNNNDNDLGSARDLRRLVIESQGKRAFK